MAASKLQLQVILSALDKATAPLKRIQGGSIGAAKALKETRDKLKELNTQQKDVSAWRAQRAAAAQTEQALGAARDKVKQLSRDIAASGAPTRQMSRDFKAAVREANALKQAHGNQQTQLQGLRNKLNAAGISTRNLGAGERDLRAKIAATNSALQQQENRLKRITTQQKRLAAAKSQYEKTQGLAGSMAGTGAAGLATGSGILYGGAKLMAPGLEFDASMSNVQALTRLDKDSPELQALRDQARELGAGTQFTAGQAADAQGYLGMAGFDPAAIKAALPGMLDLAKAGGAELAETADIASNILTGLNLQASDMGRVGDILVGTFTRSNTNLQMLGETMKYVAPVASAVGQDIETVAAMAGKLGDAGIQGSMGGTALRAILNRLSAPPKAAAKALDQLGISAKDAQGNMRAMPDILTELYAKTKDMGNADRAGLLKGIAGEEAVSALQVLVKQAGSGDLQKFIGTLREAQGEAGKTAKVMADNLAGDLATLNSAWEDLGIQVQDQQNGPMRELTQSLASVIGGVKNWIAENPELAGQIVKTAAGLGILMAAMGGITLALASILGPFAMVRYGMALFGIKGAGLAGTLFNLGKTALPMVATGLRILGAAAVANPIGAIIMAIALGAALIYANWGTVGPYFLGLWAEIKAGFAGGLGGIAALIVNFSPAGLFYRAFAGVMGYFGIELPAKFTEFGSMIMQGLVNGIANAAGAVKAAVVGAADSSINYFKEKLGIHSPSRVFASLGVDTMDGLAQGLNNGSANPFAALDDTAKQVIQKGGEISANNPFAGLAGMPELANTEQLTFDKRPPISAASNSAPAGAAPVIINVYAAAGQDANAIAQAVAREFAKQQNAQQAKQRGRLSDLE
ncbi:phage tail tape measure protein [Pseudomonas spirodelae]|uniref:Phage tail tape measure protein n=1 Tax=Pseudomonas spirodelae TaxID=3101751 RepID=A0ABU5P8Y9_9PSED|nr:phage tail tape measure protein [Pseudomonas sp. T5W1]MEA1606142.1 phage tail tape measure protein [Pseudomonas sp. T5W1]